MVICMDCKKDIYKDIVIKGNYWRCKPCYTKTLEARKKSIAWTLIEE